MTRFQSVPNNLSSLTPREREVLGYIGRGYSLREIARTLHRSLKTVETHRAALGKKLNAPNRVELAKVAIGAGMVPSFTDQTPYRTLIEHMAGGVAMTDAAGRIVYVNRALCDMMHYEPEQMRGRPVTDFMTDDSARQFLDMQDERERDTLTPYELDICRSDGQALRVRIAPRSLFDEQGKYLGSFGVVIPLDDQPDSGCEEAPDG